MRGGIRRNSVRDTQSFPSHLQREVLESVLRQQGFTLIELLIAILILLVGFLGVFTVFWSSALSGRFTRDMTTAAALGQDMLERASTLSYTDLAATGGFVTYTTASITDGNFVRKWQIEDDSPRAGMKKITAQISWNNGGQNKKRTFTMIKLNTTSKLTNCY